MTSTVRFDPDYDSTGRSGTSWDIGADEAGLTP